MPDEKLTIREAIARTTAYLEQKGSASPRLDAEVLLAEVLSTDRLHLYLDLERPLDGEERDQYREFVRRRAAHEPVAYIIGYKEFYALPFAVDRRVLTPRPETEQVVETALHYAKDLPEPKILDVGAGSGAIAVALARNLEHARIWATEMSAGALEVARENATRLGVAAKITYIRGDLFAGLEETFDMIVSNPPYIPESDREAMQADVRDYEPPEALFAGGDGLDVIRRLVDEAPRHLKPDGKLLFEFGFGQADQIGKIINANPALILEKVLHDLRRIPRVAVVART